MAYKMTRKKDVRVPNARSATEENLQNKRLKTLYEAIDAGRTKDSIEIADKLIRKFGSKDRNTPNDRITVNTASALKALALIRAENTSEASILVDNCEQALTSGEFNEGTLQVLFHCFKESYVPNRIPILIEKILKVQPASEPLLLDLYFGYTRIMDFKSQQRVANLLYKDFENRKYLFWTINSLIMQAIASPALADKMYYPLAQRMLEKAASEGRKPDRTEIILNYHVLVRRKYYDKALEYLAKHLADLNEQDSKSMKLELLKLSDDYDKLIDYVCEEIKLESLNFTNWETLFWIYEKGIESKNDELKNRLIDVIEKLLRDYLPESDKIHKQYSYLIKLLFLKQFYSFDQTQDIQKMKLKFGSVLENLKGMIALSYKRPNCFADISKFLHLLKEDEKAEFFTFVENEFKDQFETLTNAYFIRELLRTSFGHYHRMEISKRNDYLIKLVTDLRVNSKHNPELDTHAKSVAVIVANTLWDTYIETGSKLYLYQMAALLEFIFDCCSNVFIVAILLMRVYTILGNMNRIVALFNQLDIKYFQRDSLGYLTFASAMQFGRLREAIYYYTSITAQFDHNERETSESIVTANKVCSLSQIPSLVEFSEHCRSSVYALGADILNQLLSACFAVDNLHFALITLRGDDDRIDWNKVTDSRDFNVLQAVSLIDENLTEKVKKIGFFETLDLIKLMRCLGRVISDVGVANLPDLMFDADFSALRAHLAYCKSAYEVSDVNKYLQGFGAPQIVSLVSRPFLDPIIDLLEFTRRIFAIESGKDNAFSNLAEIVDEIGKYSGFENILRLCDTNSTTIAEFLEVGTHCVLSMTLCELLIKFMEARISTLLSKFNPTLTDEKVRKIFNQQHEISEHLQSLKLEDSKIVDETEATTQRKSKKTGKTRPLEEFPNEEKIVVSLKLIQINLINVCHSFEQQIVKARKRLVSTTNFFEDEGEKIDFKAANFDKYADYVNRSLSESLSRSLDDLRSSSERVKFFATLPCFNLLNIHFTGSHNHQKH